MTQATSDKLKVLFIAGNGRSGSTLLSVILGQLDGFLSVGEIYHVWERGVIQNRMCGCGQSFTECSTWQRFFDLAYGGLDVINAQQMLSYQQHMTATKRLPGMMLRPKRPLTPDQQHYVDTWEKLYLAFREATGCDVLVDASHWPTYGHLLSHAPSLDLYIVHVVRDPRAVAYSWGKQKMAEPGYPMRQLGPAKSTFYWSAWNMGISRLWDRPNVNYLLVRYEPFIRDPQRTINRIVEFVAEAPRELPFIGLNTVNLRPTHSLSGNTSRFVDGPVSLRVDDAWKSKLPARSKLIVDAMSLPLWSKYRRSQPDVI